jgi:hypothetical protein
MTRAQRKTRVGGHGFFPWGGDLGESAGLAFWGARVSAAAREKVAGEPTFLILAFAGRGLRSAPR